MSLNKTADNRQRGTGDVPGDGCLPASHMAQGFISSSQSLAKICGEFQHVNSGPLNMALYDVWRLTLLSRKPTHQASLVLVAVDICIQLTMDRTCKAHLSLRSL